MASIRAIDGLEVIHSQLRVLSSVSNNAVVPWRWFWAGKRRLDLEMGSADIAVIPCFGLARHRLPHLQALAGEDNDGLEAICLWAKP